MKRLALLVALVVVAAGCAGHGGTLRPAPPTSSTLPPEPAVVPMAPIDVQPLLGSGSVTVLDVRTPEEFAAGHLPGAVNVDVEAGAVDAALAALPSDATYVVYSNGDDRAIGVAEEMIDRGYPDVIDLVGGYDAWVAAGLATET